MPSPQAVVPPRRHPSKKPLSEQSATKSLSDLQRKFVKFWAEGDTQANALIRAGYEGDIARTRAAQIAALPHVRAEYERRKAEYADVVKMTKKRVMEMHIEAFDMAKLMSEPASMVSAAREIGKLCGYYEPKKIDITMNVNGSVRLDQMNKMTDAELLKIIEGGSLVDDHPAIGMD